MHRILVVDDHKTTRSWLCDFLESLGYTCQEAENGAVAFDLLQAHQFDLIVTDNHMPVMGGLELVETLQMNAEYENTPTILLTGDLTENVRVRAYNAGVKEVLGKPLYNRDLLLAVTRLLPLEVVDSRLSASI